MSASEDQHPSALQSKTESWRYLGMLTGIAGIAVVLAVAWWMHFFLLGLLGLVAAMVLGLCVLDYRIGLWLLLALSPTFILHNKNYGDYKLLLAVLVTAVWLAHRLRPAAAKPSPLSSHPLALPILLLILSTSVSTMLAIDPSQSIKSLLKVIGNVVFIFIFADGIRSPNSVLFYFHALLLAAGAEAVFGIVEFAHHFQQNALPVLYRSQATFPSPNVYGRYLGSVLVFLLALVFYDRQSRPVRLVLAGLISAGLLVSFSRSSMMGVAVAAAVLALVRYRPRWEHPVFLGLASAFATGFILFGGWLTWQVSHLPDPPSIQGAEETMGMETGSRDDLVHQVFLRKVQRGNIWRVGMKMVFDRPWMGHGLGMIAVVSSHYVPLTIEEIRMTLTQWEETGVMFTPLIVNAHNAGLDIVAQIGMVGLAAICAIYVTLFRRLKAFWRRKMDTLPRGMVMGGLAFLIFDWGVGFFEPACVFGPGSMGFLFVFFVAVILQIGTVRHATLV